jgi:hypothetical protein
MLDSMMNQLEMQMRTALTEFVATAHTQLEGALAEIDKERTKGLAIVVEQRAKAIACVDARRTELERDMEAMHKHKEQQEGRVELNIGGYRFETSVQTLRRVPGTFFDAYFSGLHAQDACADGSIFVYRDGDLFGHVLEFMRDGVVSVAEQDDRPSVSLLRRLKREFSFFCIELYAEKAWGMGHADLFDTLIATAKRMEGVEEERENVEDEEILEDEIEEKEVDNEQDSMTQGLRNQTWCDATGETGSQWCNQCQEGDKQLDDVYKCGATVRYRDHPNFLRSFSSLAPDRRYV